VQNEPFACKTNNELLIIYLQNATTVVSPVDHIIESSRSPAISPDDPSIFDSNDLYVTANPTMENLASASYGDDDLGVFPSLSDEMLRELGLSLDEIAKSNRTYVIIVLL